MFFHISFGVIKSRVKNQSLGKNKYLKFRNFPTTFVGIYFRSLSQLHVNADIFEEDLISEISFSSNIYKYLLHLTSAFGEVLSVSESEDWLLSSNVIKLL